MPTTSDQQSNTAAPIRFIVDEPGIDTEFGIKGRGYSPDNGQHFFVQNTTKGRVFRLLDAQRLYPLLKPMFDQVYGGPVETSLHWADILDKPDLVTKQQLDDRLIAFTPTVSWDQVTGKPDVTKFATVTGLDEVRTTADDAYSLASKANEFDDTNLSTNKRPSDYANGLFHEVKYISALSIDRSKLDVTAQTGTQVFLTTKAYNNYARQTAEVFDSDRPITFIRNGRGTVWNSWEGVTTWG